MLFSLTQNAEGEKYYCKKSKDETSITAMNYKCAQLDPRPQGEDANEKILIEASASGGVLGIEVTIPDIAVRLGRQFNLDHHGPGDTAETASACEQALACELPPLGATLVTVRPDADSVTAMAVIEAISQIGYGLSAERDYVPLVKEIGRFDRLGPSAGKPSAVVSAIARKAADFKLPLEARVKWVFEILTGDNKEAEVAELVSAHDRELTEARFASEVTLRADGRIVTVVSTHRFATTLGYEMASVVIAQNPAMAVDFKDASKGVYNKFTVCRYDSHVKCDLPAALKELQALEPGWGGRGDIFGSPQGVSSALTLDQVLEVVARHLK